MIVLAGQPDHEEANKLRARAETCPSTTTIPAATVEAAARFVPPEKGGLALMPGETQRDYTARIQAMRKRYDEALALFSSGSYQKADQAFTGIVREASDRYLEAGKYLIQSKESLRQSALKIYAEARGLESKNEWDRAIVEFRRAHETSADVAVDGDIERVVGTKTAAGLKRCEEANSNFFYKDRAALALQGYEEALKLLPPDHPCAVQAKERVSRLRK
jgi:tetratricopeptide (TPR) repeat protein